MDTRSKNNMEINYLQNLIDKNGLLRLGENGADILLPSTQVVNLLHAFSENGFLIIEMTWWEHRKKGSISELSMGGPEDIRDKDFFWGESYEAAEFKCESLKLNVDDATFYYLECIKREVFNTRLIPAISVKLFD